MASYGWVQTYPSSDPVHFDYTNATDIAKQNLIAFQRLWNRYHPSNKIAEDGIYGTNTANAFANTPCNGF